MAYNDFTEMAVWHLFSGKTVGYFSNEQINPIDIKCMKVVEELNRIIKGLVS